MKIVICILYISYDNTILKNIPFLAFEKKMFLIAIIIIVFLAVFYMPSTRIIFYGIPMG